MNGMGLSDSQVYRRPAGGQ